MGWQTLLDSVTDRKIRFLTTRPENAQFVILDRIVVVTGPPELVRLSRTGDVQVLRELINLLNKPGRAWASEVMLAAMTRTEADIVNAFARDPKRWRNSVGKTAHARWTKWLNEMYGRLSWDETNHVFTIRK
jgi:hypothetical protein